MKKIILSPSMSPTVALYGYGNAGWAVSQAWLDMGDHGFGVQEVMGSNPKGGVKSWSGDPFLEMSVSK